MDSQTRTHLDGLYSEDREIQHTAYSSLMEETDRPVDWAYEAWEELAQSLSHKNNRVRSIAAQLLCNLAKSDPDGRMVKDVALLLAVTKDERFVTARHALQSLWKIGLTGAEQRTLLVEGLRGRFRECVSEKNCTLIRYDILQGLRSLYDAVGDEKVRETALELIGTEEDLKYRKKYAGLWKFK